MNQSMLYRRDEANRSPSRSSVQVKLDKGETQGAFSLLKELIVPGPGVQLIQEESRAYYVLQGQVAFEGPQCGRFLASAGDAIHVPRLEPWTYESVGAEPCELLIWQVSDDASREYRSIKAGEGRSLSVLTDVGTFKLTGEDTGRASLLMEWRVPPLGGAPMHAQSGQETFYLLEGSFTFRGRQASGELYFLAAGPGDVIHVPERVPHSYQNTGTEPGKMLVQVAPAGRAQQFFEEIGSPVEDASAFPAAPALPDPAALIATLQKYQVDFFL